LQTKVKEERKDLTINGKNYPYARRGSYFVTVVTVNLGEKNTYFDAWTYRKEKLILR